MRVNPAMRRRNDHAVAVGRASARAGGVAVSTLQLMAQVCASKVLFFCLVAGGFVATIVLISTLFSSSDRSTDIRYGLSLSLYLKTSADGDKDRAKKLRELFTNTYPAHKIAGSVTPPTASLQRPVAEHQNWTDPVHFSNTTLSYPTRAPTDEPVHSSNTTSSYPTSAQTEAVESSTFTLPPSSRLRPGRERGYLLSMTHTQQISGALHGYTDLATLGALLNLSTVEPYVVDTSLVGVPYVKDAQYELKLCDIYDAHMLKSTLKMCSSYNDHEMSTFEDFLERASREVIFVYMLTSFNRGQKFRLAGNKRIIEIGTTGNATQKFLERLNRWAVHISPLKLPGFYISRVFVIDAQPMKALHLSDILEVLGSAIRWKVARHGSATVLFNNWEAIHNVPDSHSFYYIPEFVYRPCRSIYNVSHSQTVIDAADIFGLGLRDDKRKTRIGVHIRAERILALHKESFEICLEKVWELINSTYRNSQVRIIHDLGKYGTRTCFGYCEVLRPYFSTKIARLGWHSAHFYPEGYSHLPRSAAFVAAVEQEYLSRMDVLVTVGAGGFQTRTITMFMKHAENSRNHLYKICSDRFIDYKDFIQIL